MTDPHTLGVRARLTGKEATDNPFRMKSERWFEWADGWKDADEWDRKETLHLSQDGSSVTKEQRDAS